MTAPRALRAVPMPARELPAVLNIQAARAVDTGEPEFVIDRLYPVGATVVVSAAKAGKTTLAFQLEHWFSLGMAIGGSHLGEAERGRALIIDYEERGPLANSQSKRIAPFGSLAGDEERIPTAAELADPAGPLVHHCEWPGETFDERFDTLKKWLWEAREENRPIRLVRVDTMREFIGSTPAGMNLYQWEHACLSRLNRLGEEMNCGIVVLHHVNKQGEISGSTGIRGAVNAIYYLDRKQGEGEGCLRCDGNRYGPPRDWPLIYDLASGTWQFSDTLTLAQVSCVGTRRRILDYLTAHGPTTGPELRAALDDIKPDTGKKALSRLHSDGWVRRRDDGTWAVVDPGTGALAIPGPPGATATGWPAGSIGEAAQQAGPGLCAVCGGPMTVCEPGQAAHPGCDPAGVVTRHPAAAPSPVVQPELPDGDEDQAGEAGPGAAGDHRVIPAESAPAAPGPDLELPSGQREEGRGRAVEPTPRDTSADARRKWLAGAVARRVFKSRESAAQYETLDRILAALDAGAPPERLRILAALEGSHGEPGPFAPLRARRQPYWAPELPAVIEAAHVVEAFDYRRRGYRGPAVALDANAAWPSATSSVVVAHGQLAHTGPFDELPATGLRPGNYLVTAYPWDRAETGMPNPLGRARPGTEVWVPAPTAALLRYLAAAGRWPDASAADSWTGDPARLSDWAHLVGQLRGYAASRYGRDSDQFGAVKIAFGQAIGLMLGSWAEGEATPRRVWRCKCRRVDWVQHIKAQGAASLWRAADRARQAVPPELAPLAIRNVDELVLPEAALEAVTAVPEGGGRAPIRIDQDGTSYGTFKIKKRETWKA